MNMNLHYLALLLLGLTAVQGFNISQLSLDDLLQLSFENETTDSSADKVTTEGILSSASTTTIITITTMKTTTKSPSTTTETPSFTTRSTTTTAHPSSSNSTTESIPYFTNNITTSLSPETSPLPPPNPSTAKWALYSIIAGICLFLILTIISVTVFCLRRRRRRQSQQSTKGRQRSSRPRANTLTRGPAVDWIRPNSTISPYPLPNPYRHRETTQDRHLRTSNVDVSQWLFNED